MPNSSGEITTVDRTMTDCAWAAKVECTGVRRIKMFFEMMP